VSFQFSKHNVGQVFLLAGLVQDQPVLHLTYQGEELKYWPDEDD